MNRTKALDLLKDSINDKVKSNWDSGESIMHDVSTLLNLAKECGLIDDTQRVQIYREVNSGYELTCSFLVAIGVL